MWNGEDMPLVVKISCMPPSIVNIVEGNNFTIPNTILFLVGFNKKPTSIDSGARYLIKVIRSLKLK